MDPEAAKQILESPAFRKYLPGIDADPEDALDALKGNTRLPSLFPERMVSEYRSKGTALDKARGSFNLEVNRITFGKARGGRAAIAGMC